MQLHLTGLDLRTFEGRAPQVQAVLERREIDIDEPAAPAADEMMMVLGIRIVTDGATGPREHGDYAGLDEGLDVPIHGRWRNRRQGLAYPPVEFVRGRVVRDRGEDSQQHLTLGRHPQPLLLRAAAHALEARIDLRGFQVHASSVAQTLRTGVM